MPFMDPTAGTATRSSPTGPESEETGLNSLQFNEEVHRLMTVPPENPSSFTALFELPVTQDMELLHSPYSGKSPPLVSGDDNLKYCFHLFNGTLTLPSNTALIERAARFSVFAGEHNRNYSPEISSVPSNSSANLEKVKSEPTETESSKPLVSDLSAENQSPNQNQRSVKRKEREKKVKGSTKKSKSAANERSEDVEKLPYVHVRACRGQATDSHSIAERARREKINARMKLLQELVPGCNKISGTALVLDEIINHVQCLQRQVEFLSMRLAAVNPRIDFDIDSILAAESGSLMDSNFPGMVMSMWPDLQLNGSRQLYQQQCHFDAFHQPIWGREEDSNNFITPENSLFSYDSSGNSATLHSNQLKMEL